MTDEEIYEAAIQTLLRETRLTFWKRLRYWLEWAYSDAFQEVANDANVLTDQRSAKLLDDRFYLAERAILNAARESGLLTTAEKVTINNWNYTLVRAGGVCMVQSYLQTPSDMTRSAKFREAHAAINQFLSEPRLPFGDVEPAIFDISKLNGIITHGPVGRDFDEDEQQLAFLNFSIPDEKCRVWGINITVAEIIARMEHVERGIEIVQRDIAKPRIRRRAKKIDEGDE